MERRGFITALRFAALTAPASAASEKPAKPASRELGREAKLCRAGAGQFALPRRRQDCLRRALPATKDVALADCANSTADVVAACGALTALAGLGSPYAPAFARTVADLCLACKKDCDKLLRVAECAALGAACANCAAECAKAAG